MTGVTLGNADTLLTERAVDFLAAGPADARTLISHVCQLPGAPTMVAEHMATALFAGHTRFMRDNAGRWMLRESTPAAYDDRALMPDLHRESFVVVDVETTGSRPWGGDRVTEIAVVRVHDGIATPVFDTLVNPERAIPPSIVAITNITWEMVKDAPKFADVCDQLLGVLEGHVFVAHNATFDWRFLSSEIERVTRRPLEGRRLCTVRMARRLLPQLPRRNLDALAAFYGIENGARHRAGGDAIATAQILLRMLDAARDRGCTTLSELDQLLAAATSRPKRPRRAPALPQPARDDLSA